MDGWQDIWQCLQWGLDNAVRDTTVVIRAEEHPCRIKASSGMRCSGKNQKCGARHQGGPHFALKRSGESVLNTLPSAVR